MRLAVRQSVLLRGTFVEHQALKNERLQMKLAHKGFVLLRKLAAHTGQLPDSYLVKKGMGFQIEKTILASGGFADIRRGKLAEKEVAVKTVRTTQDDSLSVRKVRTTFGARFRLYMNPKYRTFARSLCFGCTSPILMFWSSSQSISTPKPGHSL